MKFSYFNDRFELRVGDIVYVEGKLEDLRGQGVDVTHNFRIKISEYKRIIGKVDTSVSGNLHMAGSNFVVFTPNAIPFEKVLISYKIPDKEGDESVTGNDDTSFTLDNLSVMHISSEIAECGHDYYLHNKISALMELAGMRLLKAQPYEVEFTYKTGRLAIWFVTASAATHVNMSLLKCCNCAKLLI